MKRSASLNIVYYSSVLPITEGFLPSQNILVKPWVYMGFFIIQIYFDSSFMHYFSYEKGPCFPFFHVKYKEKFLICRNSRFSEGWTVLTETKILLGALYAIVDTEYRLLRQIMQHLKATIALS